MKRLGLAFVLAIALAVPSAAAAKGELEQGSLFLCGSDRCRSIDDPGTLDGLTYLLVGDMRMRTMHSILYALSQFDAKAYVVGPPEMSLLPEFTLELDDRNVEYEVAESVEDCISECDVIYMEPVVQADYTQSRVERDDGGGGLPPPALDVVGERARLAEQPVELGRAAQLQQAERE